jgi:PTH1 family peptidyl-tRNA hydrolase
MTWLVAGLGNPGERYARNRHNLGYRVVDALADERGERFRKARFVPADTAEIRHGTERVILAKAHAYMNETGPAFASLSRKHHVEPDHVIVVHDEIDLALGALRVKFGGSTAGHNGVRSVAAALRTPDFFRVRLGVGRPTGRKEAADWVLEDFAKRDQPEVEILLADGAEATLAIVSDGLETTQERFNRAGPRD